MRSPSGVRCKVNTDPPAEESKAIMSDPSNSKPAKRAKPAPPSSAEKVVRGQITVEQYVSTLQRRASTAGARRAKRAAASEQ
jgi:hypothetical protein